MTARHRLPDPTTLALGTLTMLFLAALVGVLGLWIHQAWPAITDQGTSLLTGGEWFYREQRFGAAAMIYGSAVVSLLALLAAAPLGFAAAVFISEFLPATLRLWAKTNPAPSSSSPTTSTRPAASPTASPASALTMATANSSNPPAATPRSPKNPAARPSTGSMPNPFRPRLRPLIIARP